MSVSVIVLAAGKGTRMRSDLAKVLHRTAGLSLLEWVLKALDDLDVADMAVVVGHQAVDVAARCPTRATTIVQEPQLGTGHAAMVGMEGLAVSGGHILVLPGDMPLLRARTLAGLVERHAASGAAATIASVELDDPSGYGRIIRVDGAVTGIVEERDATSEQRGIREVNTSVYVFDGAVLAQALDRLSNDNDQGEYYLTDVIATMVGDGRYVDAFPVPGEEGVGVNTQGQLAQVGAVLRRRINDSLLDAGVWMLDPSRVYIDAGVVVEPGARIHPDTYLEGATIVASGTDVGPGVRLYDTTVARGARVHNAVAVSARIGEDASVGPFAYLRPGAVIERGAKVGTYVEIKGSTIGEGSKVPHLSYIGDAIIGRGSNIGAGTITVNYDGYEKHRTTIGDNVRIGSDTMLVAPVTVGDEAFTGAGSVITNDVPPGVLAIERSAQKHIDGYAEKRRLRAEGNDG